VAKIILDHVTKHFPDGTVAVDNFGLEIGDGEFVILVGPSGCGKSTTLNMIAGLEDITEGELRIDGERMNERAPRERDIAMVFQNYALYPHMTVRENIAFPLKLAGMDRAAIDQRVEHAAGLLDLTQHLDRKPANLSGGQRQRVAMGRAIVRSPKAFLMDEPLSNLDAKLRMQMRTTISRLQKNLGTTTVYVTHDQTEAMTLGDRIVLMRSGLIQQVGPPEELYEHPRNLFVAGFIGAPPMNFLPAELSDGAIASPIGAIPLGPRLRRALTDREVAGEVVVGIRPEALEDSDLVPAPDHAVTFSGTVDILEFLGAEKLAYFTLDSNAVDSEHLAELARDSDAEDLSAVAQLVALLEPRSTVREGQQVTLWFDPDAVHLFEPKSGTTLTEATA
jgi:multiple sugar transport system ATP-binding protein